MLPPLASRWALGLLTWWHSTEIKQCQHPCPDLKTWRLPLPTHLGPPCCRDHRYGSCPHRQLSPTLQPSQPRHQTYEESPSGPSRPALPWDVEGTPTSATRGIESPSSAIPTKSFDTIKCFVLSHWVWGILSYSNRQPQQSWPQNIREACSLAVGSPTEERISDL